jgi:hypothetical protein
VGYLILLATPLIVWLAVYVVLVLPAREDFKRVTGRTAPKHWLFPF